MLMIYTKNFVYQEKFIKVDYNKNYSEFVLIRSCREPGYEEVNNNKVKTDKSEIERIEVSRIKSKIKEYALCNDFQYFFTQTLNNNYNRYDLNEFKLLIQKKFKAYKRKNSDFKYLIIYEKHKDGHLTPLAQKNVDTGWGLERNLAFLNGTKDVYRTDLFAPVIAYVEEQSKTKYEEDKE